MFEKQQKVARICQKLIQSVATSETTRATRVNSGIKLKLSRVPYVGLLAEGVCFTVQTVAQ